MFRVARLCTVVISAASIYASAAGSGTSKNQKKAEESSVAIEEKVVIDRIWSPVSVGFALLTHGDVQYAAYYNSERRMVVAMRKLSEPEFTRKILPSKSPEPPTRNNSSTIQGWDSHNYITMAVDREGVLHLAGNMHANKLTYFKSQQPSDIQSMEQVDAMVGKNEDRCTYPKFMYLKNGDLLFHYRDGWSGNGSEIYNVYDTKTGRWRRFLATPLIDGRGKMNAYQNGPRLGPDGWYHILWVWRDTPDAATNHDLSYARSKDLIHWETAAGEELKLPITFDDKGAVVDPVPVNGGIINGCHHFGFDSNNRIVVTYHKHDRGGNTQAYAARFLEHGWVVSQVSDWRDRHIFKGGGSGPSTYGTSLRLQSIDSHGKGKLALPYSHWKEGSGLLVLDEETLKPLGVEPKPSAKHRFPGDLTKVESDFDGMSVRWREDSGDDSDAASRYVLRWESLGSNRDRPRDKPWPEPGELVLYKLRAQ